MKLYVVQNSKGQFFRPRGQHEYQNQWRDDIGMAKFYTKIGQAKTQCTLWYGYYPKLGCPHILEFDIDPTKAIILDMLELAEKSISKMKQKNKQLR